MMCLHEKWAREVRVYLTGGCINMKTLSHQYGNPFESWIDCLYIETGSWLPVKKQLKKLLIHYQYMFIVFFLFFSHRYANVFLHPVREDLAPGYHSVVFRWVFWGDNAWWFRDMDKLSALVALCEGNPPVTGGFPSQRATNAELWHSLLLLAWISYWTNSIFAIDLVCLCSVNVMPEKHGQ